MDVAFNLYNIIYINNLSSKTPFAPFYNISITDIKIIL